MWSRPQGDSKFHRVIEASGGSSITACRGRWPVSHVVTLDPNPLWADRCGMCREAPAVRMEWDMTDAEDA